MKLIVRDLCVYVPLPGGGKRTILSVDALEVQSGESLCFTGPSGAGKTTLLYALTGLCAVESGEVLWDGKNLADFSEMEKDAFRREEVGYLFQDYRLFDKMSALDNVLVSDLYSKEKVGKKNALKRLEEAGIRYPRTMAGALSGGEKQRVALVRALFREPGIVAADEPGVQLDRENREKMADRLFLSAQERGATLLVVSHEEDIQKRTDRVITIKDGVLS